MRKNSIYLLEKHYLEEELKDSCLVSQFPQEWTDDQPSQILGYNQGKRSLINKWVSAFISQLNGLLGYCQIDISR